MKRKRIDNADEIPAKNLAVFRVMERKGLNAKKLADMIGGGLAAWSINRLSSPDRRTGAYPKLTDNLIDKITEALKLPDNWIEEEIEQIDREREEVEFEGKEQQGDKSDAQLPVPYGADNKMTKLELKPHITNVEAAAGPLSGYVDAYTEWLPVIKHLPYYDFTIQISGDSMEPTLRSGDVIAIRDVTQSSFKQWGHIHVLSTQQGTVVKRIYPDEKVKGYKCVSDNNEKYPPYSVPEEEVYGIYIYVGLVRR